MIDIRHHLDDQLAKLLTMLVREAFGGLRADVANMEAHLAQIDDDLAALSKAAGDVATAVTAGLAEIKALLANPGGPSADQLAQIESITTNLEATAASMTAALPTAPGA